MLFAITRRQFRLNNYQNIKLYLLKKFNKKENLKNDKSVTNKKKLYKTTINMRFYKEQLNVKQFNYIF